MSWQPPQIAVTVFLPGPSGKSWAWAGKTQHTTTAAAVDAEISNLIDMTSVPRVRDVPSLMRQVRKASSGAQARRKIAIRVVTETSGSGVAAGQSIGAAEDFGVEHGLLFNAVKPEQQAELTVETIDGRKRIVKLDTLSKAFRRISPPAVLADQRTTSAANRRAVSDCGSGPDTFTTLDWRRFQPTTGASPPRPIR
jgi:hypothetical protein